MTQQWRTVLFGIGLLFVGSAVAIAQTPGLPNQDPDLIRWVVGGAILMLILLLFGILANFFWLQRRLLQDCTTRGAIGDYLKLPMGVPEGTIRGIITFIIVVVSLVILVVQIGLNAAGKAVFTFPETLSAILGTVIAFYFGSRAGGGSGGRELQKDTEISTVPVDEGRRTEHHALAGKIEQGLNAAAKLSDILPESLLPVSKEKVQKTVTAAKSVIASAQTLLVKGKIDAAEGVLTTAKEMLAGANPAVSILKGALKTFSSVLREEGQPLLFLTALLGGGGSLAGQAYTSWKRRILEKPFEAADFPAQTLSATTALGLYAKDETLKKIFEKEISKLDFAGLLRSFREILNAGEPQSLVAQYQTQIAAASQTPEEFLKAIERMKKAFMDQYLEDMIDGSALREIGGLAPFMEAVKKINDDPNAKTEIEKVMEVDEQMKKTGQDSRALMELVEASPK